MLILELALAAFLSTRGTASTVPPAAPPPVAIILEGAELVHAIKTDIEALSGPGSVDVSIDNKTLYSVRVAVPSFRTEICSQIYDRELKLYKQFPDLNFDFYLRLRPARSRQSRP